MSDYTEMALGCSVWRSTDYSDSGRLGSQADFDANQGLPFGHGSLGKSLHLPKPQLALPQKGGNNIQLGLIRRVETGAVITLGTGTVRTRSAQHRAATDAAGGIILLPL